MGLPQDGKDVGDMDDSCLTLVSPWLKVVGVKGVAEETRSWGEALVLVLPGHVTLTSHLVEHDLLFPHLLLLIVCKRPKTQLID